MRTQATAGQIVVNILIGILLLGGCGQPQQPGQGGPPQGGPPPEVAVVTIQPKRLVITTELAGRTSAGLVSDVRPQVSGVIKRRLFAEGADVKAGQPLYQIDPAPYEAALENAKAALGRSEANLPAIRLKADRVRELLADRAVSQQDYDDVSAALKQSEADIAYWKAAVEAARINLGYTTITAPIAGRIGRSTFTAGALATAHQPVALATIQQLDPMFVDVPQSTAELLRLRGLGEDRRAASGNGAGSRVHLLLEDGGRYPWEGRLQFRDVTVDPTTGSVVLRVVIPNPQGILLPGMFVRAVVEEGTNPKAILVPQQAVSRDPKGNPTALIVDAEGKVAQRMLATERAIGNEWLVSSGLAPGDRVIVEGTLKVMPGMPVKAVEFEEGDGKNGAAASKAAPAKTGGK